MIPRQHIFWTLGYFLEERRQVYAARGCLLRQAAVCLLLALLRLFRRA